MYNSNKSPSFSANDTFQMYDYIYVRIFIDNYNTQKVGINLNFDSSAWT